MRKKRMGSSFLALPDFDEKLYFLPLTIVIA